MDLEKIKAQIAELKDKIVDNVNRNFNNYHLEDILDSGELEIIDKPIDDNDWYWYWKQQALDLREIFYTLLKEEIPNNKQSEFLNECMELKKVVDKNLISNPNYNYNDLMEWFGVKTDDEDNKNHIPLSKDDQLNSKIIKALYEALSNEGLIDTSFDSFNNHFTSSTTESTAIKWLGTELKIVALISQLIDNDIIPKSQRNRIIPFATKHFINKKGNNFKEKQLSVVKSRVNDKLEIDNYKDITNIVEKLVQIN